MAMAITPRRVVFAHECGPCSLCGEPECLECGDHYADCECPGPNSTDEWNIVEHADGSLWATSKQ